MSRIVVRVNHPSSLQSSLRYAPTRRRDKRKAPQLNKK